MYYDINGQLISVGDKVSVREKNDRYPSRFSVITGLITVDCVSSDLHGQQFSEVLYGDRGANESLCGAFGVSMDRITKITDEEYDEAIVLHKLTKV